MTEANSPKTSSEPSRASQFRLPVLAKIGLLCLVLLLASIGYFTSSLLQNKAPSQTNGAELDSSEAAKRPPVADFDLIDADGKSTPFNQYKGQVVLVSFWASWCTPCLVEMPSFAEIEDKLGDKGLKIVPINVDDGPQGKTFASDFWQKKKFKFANYFDADKSRMQKFGVEFLPSNFVVDRQGRLAFSGYGANDWNSPQMLELLEGLLAEQ